ncbi:MAG: hypothetical protein K9J76_00945 [Polaromonas sp.]|nr:hypothetical protein [Polaromonas sp.]
MKWPTIDQLSAMTPLPEGYRHDWLKRSEIPALIACVARWHPDIAVGGGSCYLREDFYNDHVFLDGETEKNIIVGLFKHADELAGMWSLEQEPYALTLYSRLIIIAPEHRSAKLASKAMPLVELVGRTMGAEFLYGAATLKIPHMQHALESSGWQLIGFTSGYDREQVAPGVVKRVFEGVFTKVLVPDDELVRPNPDNLTPRARALFEVLFPNPQVVSAQSVTGSGK